MAIAGEYEWRPIETAPRDGTRILLLLGDHRIESGKWVDAEEDGPDSIGADAGWLSDSGWTMPGRSFGHFLHRREPMAPPTHWMPLPEPPEDEKGA